MKLGYSFGLLLLLQSCFLLDPQPATENLPEFLDAPSQFVIETTAIKEASGIASSKSIPGHLWVEEDSGSPSEINLISNTGEYIGNVAIENANNRDWEDICVGPGPEDSQSYVYIADTGDNLEVYGSYVIYRFIEPNNINTVPTADQIHFTYEGGDSYDAETIMIDPSTKDLYIVTKRQLNVRVYKLTYPYSTTESNIASFQGTISLPFIVAGDISSDGTEILMKSLNSIFYWKVRSGESVYKTISRTRDISAPYQRETQGEAITFSLDQNSYFTLSEEDSNATTSNLYQYFKK